MNLIFMERWMSERQFYPWTCCCSWSVPWLGSWMFSPGKQGRRGSAVWTRDTLQVTGSTHTWHHAGKSTGRCTLGGQQCKEVFSMRFGSNIFMQKKNPSKKYCKLCEYSRLTAADADGMQTGTLQTSVVHPAVAQWVVPPIEDTEC